MVNARSTNESQRYNNANPLGNMFIICVCFFQDFTYAGNGGAISLDFDLSSPTIGQVYITKAVFNRNTAIKGGSIYYKVPQGSEILDSCFVENKAESGRAIYFDGAFANFQTNLNFNTFYRSLKGLSGNNQDDAIIASSKDARYTIDIQADNFTLNEQTQQTGAGYAMDVSLYSSGTIKFISTQFSNIDRSQAVYLNLSGSSGLVTITDVLFLNITVSDASLFYLDGTFNQDFNDIHIIGVNASLTVLYVPKNLTNKAFEATHAPWAYAAFTPDECYILVYKAPEPTNTPIPPRSPTQSLNPSRSPTQSLNPSRSPTQSLNPPRSPTQSPNPPPTTSPNSPPTQTPVPLESTVESISIPTSEIQIPITSPLINSSEPNESYEDPPNSVDSGSNAGLIAGIAGAVAAVIAGAIVAAYFILKKKKSVSFSSDGIEVESVQPAQPHQNRAMTQLNPLFDENAVGGDDPFAHNI